MYSREIKERLQSMTIEEKARLCAGKIFGRHGEMKDPVYRPC